MDDLAELIGTLIPHSKRGAQLFWTLIGVALLIAVLIYT